MTIILLQYAAVVSVRLFIGVKSKVVRGCQKKIIYLKNTRSSVFDEAYFVIKDSTLYESKDECDMVEEANKILSEAFDFDDMSVRKRIARFLKKNTISFIVGFILGIVSTLIFI